MTTRTHNSTDGPEERPGPTGKARIVAALQRAGEEVGAITLHLRTLKGNMPRTQADAYELLEEIAMKLAMSLIDLGTDVKHDTTCELDTRPLLALVEAGAARARGNGTSNVLIDGPIPELKGRLQRIQFTGEQAGDAAPLNGHSHPAEVLQLQLEPATSEAPQPELRDDAPESMQDPPPATAPQDLGQTPEPTAPAAGEDRSWVDAPLVPVRLPNGHEIQMRSAEPQASIIRAAYERGEKQFAIYAQAAEGVYGVITTVYAKNVMLAAAKAIREIRGRWDVFPLGIVIDLAGSERLRISKQGRLLCQDHFEREEWAGESISNTGPAARCRISLWPQATEDHRLRAVNDICQAHGMEIIADSHDCTGPKPKAKPKRDPLVEDLMTQTSDRELAEGLAADIRAGHHQEQPEAIREKKRQARASKRAGKPREEFHAAPSENLVRGLLIQIGETGYNTIQLAETFIMPKIRAAKSRPIDISKVVEFAARGGPKRFYVEVSGSDGPEDAQHVMAPLIPHDEYTGEARSPENPEGPLAGERIRYKGRNYRLGGNGSQVIVIAPKVQAEEEATPFEPNPALIQPYLHQALNIDKAAEARFEALRRSGATDEQIHRAIDETWGEGVRVKAKRFGYRGGKHLAFWHESDPDRRQPTIAGGTLIAMAREVLEIPEPRRQEAEAGQQARKPKAAAKKAGKQPAGAKR